MRLWSLHPKYLDTAGLTACWREGLLARSVLAGKTKGYTHHPQLQRFRASENPLQAIDFYLQAIWREAKKRNFNYDATKIDFSAEKMMLQVTDKQLQYEFEHLQKKLLKRSPQRYLRKKTVKKILPHPMFQVVEGEIAAWEKAGSGN